MAAAIGDLVRGAGRLGLAVLRGTLLLVLAAGLVIWSGYRRKSQQLG